MIQSPQTSEYDHIFRILLIGNASVGKTSLLHRYVDDTFSDHFIPTIGIDFRIKTIQLGGKTIKLQVWDTAGPERFRTITSSYYRGADGILLCYDLTVESSFEHCECWLRDIHKYAKENVILMLLGNKCDKCEGTGASRKVLFEEGRTFAEANQMLFLETSARSGANVEETFSALTAAIFKTVATPPVVAFTLLSIESMESLVHLWLAALIGETIDIDIAHSKATVEAASRAIAETRGLPLRSVRLVTSDGKVLDSSDHLPGFENLNDIGGTVGGRRCEIQ